MIDAVKAVTKRWLKQRKAEERNRAAAENRAEALRRSRRGLDTRSEKAAFEVMDRGFMPPLGGQLTPMLGRSCMRPAIISLRQAPTSA